MVCLKVIRHVVVHKKWHFGSIKYSILDATENLVSRFFVLVRNVEKCGGANGVIAWCTHLQSRYLLASRAAAQTSTTKDLHVVEPSNVPIKLKENEASLLPHNSSVCAKAPTECMYLCQLLCSDFAVAQV